LQVNFKPTGWSTEVLQSRMHKQAIAGFCADGLKSLLNHSSRDLAHPL
jgi:hypothetical protein